MIMKASPLTQFHTLRHAIALSVLIASLVACAPAWSQAIERHPVTPVEPMAGPLLAPNVVPDDLDDTPIGPVLQSLVVLGKGDPLKAAIPSPLDLSSVARLSASPAAEADLRPFLGQQLSRKLIAQIEAAIARRYRALGYPFVSLSTPAQEISSGVLQIRVIEYSVGKLKTRGVKDRDAAALKRRTGLEPGDPINAADLGDRLLWINRYPYRQVQAVFTPGALPGDSDLILAATSVKPWQVYAGYDNSGSPSSSIDRYQLGGAIGGLGVAGSLLSVQATGSRDALDGVEHPRYASEAISFILPLATRAQLEVSLNHIETNQSSSPFAVRLKTDEGSLGLRFGAPSLLPGAASHADLRIGVSAKHQEAITLFGGVNIFDAPIEDYSVFLGYHLQQQSARSRSIFDLALHAAPGNLDGGDSDTQSRLFSHGRANRSSYLYSTLYFDHVQRMGRGLDWRVQLIGQWSAQALPRTEQAGVGGSGLVRGYSLDTGSFDQAVVVRNEIRTELSPKGLGRLSPYAFVDVGAGRDMHLKAESRLASVGLGAEASLSSHTSVNLALANLLRSTSTTRTGGWKLEASLSVRF
jgi:hemolysin activation/secretion protein